MLRSLTGSLVWEMAVRVRRTPTIVEERAYLLAGGEGRGMAEPEPHRFVCASARSGETLFDDFYAALRSLAEKRLAEVQEIRRDFALRRGGLEEVDQRRLLERARAGEILVLDVRPREEYRAGHIAGAVSVPLKELESRLAALPKDREMVAYCRGPYCVLAPDAVTLLRSHGYRAGVLGDGVAEWRARGLPVSAGDAP